MKKNILLLTTLVLVLLLISCSTTEQPVKIVEKTENKPTIEPIILDIMLSDKGLTFQREIADYMNPEYLESHVDYYGLADITGKCYHFVKDDQLEVFKMDQANGNLLGPNGQVFPYKMIDGNLAIETQALADKLGLTVEKHSNLRIIKTADSSFKKAILNGTAYADYGKQQDKKFAEKEVDIVNIAEGFALIIADNKPYLTSELNLTMFQNELEDKESAATVEPPLVLAWDLYGNQSEQAIDSLVDVVIPKWLSLQNEAGDINDLFRPQYTDNVRKQGAKLWVLVNNSFDPDMTAAMLKSCQARQNFIDQLIQYAKKNKVDGINLDFENIYLKDSDRYVQLAAELHVATKQIGIPLSIAVTVPGGSDNWSKVYDRKRLAKVSEYVTLMAYDQHWENSQTSGPVAGLNWVDQNIAKTLEMVPADKLVLGLPFYTRVWYERLSTEKPNQMKVRSKSVFMNAPRKLIDENDPVRVWDEENSQYYFAYFEGDSLVKFWYDDPAAIARKAKLFKKYQLAGIACWSLGFESPEIWPALKTVLQSD